MNGLRFHRGGIVKGPGPAFIPAGCVIHAMPELQPIWRCKCGYWEVRHERAVNAIPTCPYCCACARCLPGQFTSRDGAGRYYHHRSPVRMYEAVRRNR